MRPAALPCFDDLLELAKNAPEDLEALRLSMTLDILNSTLDEGMRQRLEQLAFRIDAERRSGRPPLALCIHYSALMHEHLQHLNQELGKLFQADIHQTPSQPTNNKVVSLEAYRHKKSR